MSKITKKSFEYFKGMYELKECSWIVEDEYYKKIIEPELNKMQHTKFMAEFMFKCLYPNEKPLSKKDYGRTRFTHRVLSEKYDTLCQVRTESENESFQRMCRSLNLQKAVYGFYSWNDFKDTEFAKDYIEKGIIKKEGIKFARQMGLI